MVDFERAATLFLFGLFKKLVIADNLSPIVERVFSTPTSFSGFEVFAATLAFALQIYADFSGYTDMARGIASCFGFDLVLNFERPYFSVTASMFWRRWHMSLSQWLRDYVYIPLGGNRDTWLNVSRNLLVTMIVCGIWHGSAWNFIFWGIYQALLLILYRPLRPALEASATRSLVVRTALALVLFVFVSLGWILFRSGSLANACEMFSRLSSSWSLSDFTKQSLVTTVLLALPLFVYDLLSERARNELVILRWPPFIRGPLYVFLLFLLCIWGNTAHQNFIYSRF